MARANMGLDFVLGQYGCLFSRCRKYVIDSLIHGHFHIGLIIIPRPVLALDSVSGQYGGLGMITRPIWKCPCIYNIKVLIENYHVIFHLQSFLIDPRLLVTPLLSSIFPYIFTPSDHPFGIFNLFLELHLLVTPLVSSIFS